MGRIMSGELAKLWRETQQNKRDLNVNTRSIEDALVELGEMLAEQDDALVELAGLIEEEE